MDPDAALMNGLTRTRNEADLAARNGHLKVLKWLDEKKIKCTPRGADLAADGGHLDMVKWLFYEKNISVSIGARIWIWVSDICRRGDNYVRSRHTKNKLE